MPEPELMRAVVLTEPRRAEVLEVERPLPGPRHVLVRVEGCGLSAASVQHWQGRPWLGYPMPAGVPGHEGWGRVEALGSEVTQARVGERVGFLSNRSLAEYDIAEESQLARIPESLGDRHVPAEALAGAVGAFKRADIRAGQSVAVVGIGFLGALITELAAGAGARVLAISRRDEALEHARSLGATATLSLDAHAGLALEASRRIGEGIDRLGFERVVEAAGLQRTLDVASGLIGIHGRLVIAGFHGDGRRSVDMQTWNYRGIDVVSAHTRDPELFVDNMRAALGAIARGELHPDPLCTAFPLDRITDAFDCLESRPSGFIKAILKP